MNHWKINLNKEYGSIGEKVTKKWLRQKGFKVYTFNEIELAFFTIKLLENRLKSSRSPKIINQLKSNLVRGENLLNIIFGVTLVRMKRYMDTLQCFRKVSKKKWASDHYKRVGIGSDFIVKKDDEIVFEVKVNESEPKKISKTSFKIAQEHGFKRAR